ncbi:hypothetical protein PWT90_07502 [Aphanocladium album]|nr:hypothetical protein PWT90_07502 [Aphanocladium album]
MQQSFGAFNVALCVSSVTVYAVASDDGKLCFGGIQGSNQISIFGDIAFKSNLVVFDVGGNRVGWASK